MSHPGARNLVVWAAVMAAAMPRATAFAQQQNLVPSGPAPVLMTVSETLQPGAEAAHAKLEADYAAALDAGKGNQFYLGMGAITGTPQIMFLSGYASLQEMADVHDQDETTLGETLANLDEQHSATLTGMDTAIWRLRPDLSNPNPANLATMRYIDLIHIHVKLGHSAEFADIFKTYKEGWMKADPNFHFSLYQQVLGAAKDDSYMLVISVKSLADLDKHYSLVPAYRTSLDEAARKRMLDFESANYDGIESNLFVFTPSMSRLPQSWRKQDPDFWNPKPSAPVPAKKADTTKK